MSRRLLPLALSLLVVPAAFAQDAPVATVNGEAIPMSEFVHRLEWFRPDPKSSLVGLPAGFQVVRQMISERIILQMAKAKGVAPTAPEIDARIAQLNVETPNLKEQMALAGTTDADLRTQVVNQEAQFKLVTSGITITDQQVEAYYKSNAAEFEVPAQYKLRLIAVKDDAGQKAVDDALKAGKAFDQVARDLSKDVATSANGGEFGLVSEATIDDATRKAIQAVKPGSTTTWVLVPVSSEAGKPTPQDTKTRVKLLVESVTPMRVLPLDAAMRTRIRRRLMLQRGKTKEILVQDLEAATQAAKVTISEPKFQAMYAQLLASSQKAQG